MRQIPLLFALLSTLPAAMAQTGLNSLPEVEFSQLSQRDPNPLGERALSINPTQWKHGETEHYIYHFAHSYVATPISVEAEFHYRVVAKELERDQPHRCNLCWQSGNGGGRCVPRDSKGGRID